MRSTGDVRARAAELILGSLSCIGLVLGASQATAQTGDRPSRSLPASIAAQKLDTPISATSAEFGALDPRARRGGDGTKQVLVRLQSPSVARSGAADAAARRAHKEALLAEQADFIERCRAASPELVVLARTQVALNAVALEIDAAAVADIAQDPSVVRVSGVRDYELHLGETVPYIGASAVHGEGFDGSGVRIAILDTGIDYTHAHFGGSGDPADYAANDPSIIEPGSFPTAKVVDGFDFVGSVWPSGPLAPDPDPLDGATHGTHVADIAGGLGGVAPGADLLAVKVCSDVSTACSGVALIQAMDFAVDPDGDGDPSDAVDVINMSLGADYGTFFDDDLSQAVENATALGVLTVSSAGNGSDRPYVTGTPSSAPTALSVAQTNVPSALQPLMEITAPAEIAGLYAAVFQAWSAPLTSLIAAPIVYGDGAGGNLDGCLPFAAGTFSGEIVLVDRGTCFFTTKIFNIGNAGGAAGIIGLVAPGDPFSGGFADPGGPITVPGFMISQADSGAIKFGLSLGVVDGVFDPASGIPLVMHMVGSSSRGPSMGSNPASQLQVGNLLKPEIGAPGASVSAQAATGTGVTPFGGTSGASPMVAGSAALLMQAFPSRTPGEIKAVLMNRGETDIQNEPVFFGGDLAPITRIGGGEVRVAASHGSSSAAWDVGNPTGGLSFGQQDVDTKNFVMKRIVKVRNYSDSQKRFFIDPTFRFAGDDDGSVQLRAPLSVWVPAHGQSLFPVFALVRGDLLPPWGLNSGSNGNSGAALTAQEYDGYVELTEATDGEVIRLPWHILPRKSGRVFRGDTGIPNQHQLVNLGVADSFVEAYSLIGTSLNLPPGGPGQQSPTPDLKYVGYSTIPVGAGFCSGVDSFVMLFAVNTWETQTHAIAPAHFEFDLDIDQDGIFDFAVLNFDLSFSGSLSDGRNVTWVVDLATGDASAFFFTDHETNSGNTVLIVCGEQIGMNASNFFDPFDVEVLAVDWYYSGDVTDFLSGITISPLGEQFLGIFDTGGVGADLIPSRDSAILEVLDFGPLTNNTETGLLLLNRFGAKPANEAGIIRIP